MKKIDLSDCIAVNDKKICIYLLACEDVQFRCLLPQRSDWNFYFSQKIKVSEQIAKYLSGKGDTAALSQILPATEEYNQIKEVVLERYEPDGVIICACCGEKLFVK